MKTEVQELLHELTCIRRELHQHPEKGLSEYWTSKYIEEYLKSLNIEVITGIAGTAVIGVLKGDKGISSVAVRADMDCLEVTEQTGVEFCSKIPGMMHACGHDGHMAAVLVLAKLLSRAEQKLKNNVVFIFQPAEEGPGGAELIVKSGVLDRFDIKAVLGMHIFPEIKQGKIGCCSGPITARNGEVDIEIEGKSAHGALPQTGIDSIVASSQIVQALQTIISRKIDPRDNAVVTLGKIFGGEARNIIAGKTTMEGTIRAFSKSTYDAIKQNIADICEGICRANGCRADVQIRDMYPEVYNDENLFSLLLKAAEKDEIEIIKPLMIAEDFSFYREVAPELMFLLGSGNEEKGFVYPLHNSRFNFEEEILLRAVSLFSSMINLLDLK